MNRRFAKEHWVGLAAILLFIVGCYIGLFVAPAERHMGEVQRIMYVHVPVAVACYVAFFVTALASRAQPSGRRTGYETRARAGTKNAAEQATA